MYMHGLLRILFILMVLLYKPYIYIYTCICTFTDVGTSTHAYICALAKENGILREGVDLSFYLSQAGHAKSR